VSSRRDGLPQIVCFDTAFFSTLPEITRRFPFPASLYEHPVQRHGFHGLSYESIVVLRGIGQTGHTILAHLGHGSSMVALRNGHPIDVHHESGLLGVSGSSSDMRVILERRSRDERAALAFEMYCYETKKAIGALVAALGGIDNLVFTGGIGEHAAPVRERICANLDPVGIELDDARNRSRSPDVISRSGSPCMVRVISANEELVIATHARRILGDAR
jgi:acetate kinase